MPVYVYGLVASDVAEEVPGIDAGLITTTTVPISTSKLTQWIEDGAASINALLARHSITPSAALDADTHAQLAAAVKAYAVSKALQVIGRGGGVYQQAWTRWRAAYESFAAVPATLGADYSPSVVCAVDGDADGVDNDPWDFTSSDGDVW